MKKLLLLFAAMLLPMMASAYDFTIDGMENLKKEDGQVSFLYRGHMKSLLKMLSEEKISDINIEDPDLEEVFLHYYKEGDEL